MRRLRTLLSTIYFRFAAAMLAVLIPLLATQFIMWRWGSRAVREELVSAASSYVQYLCSHFHNTVNSVMIQLTYLYSNSTVSDFLVAPGQEDAVSYYTNISSLMSVLRLVPSANYYIEDLTIYYLPLDLAVSDSLVEKETNEEAMEIIACAEAAQTSLIRYEDQFMVTLAKPNIPGQGNQLYLAAATLKMSYLRDHLGDYDTYSGKKAFMVYHGTKDMVFSEAMSLEEIEVAREVVFQSLRTDTEETYTLDLQSSLKDRYLAVACYSNILKSSFVQLIPQEKLQEIPDRLRGFIVLFSVLAVLVVMVFAMLLHRLVKKPLSDLEGSFGKIEEGVFGTTLIPAYSYEYNELVGSFNHMSVRLAQLVKENYEQTIYLQEAELKQLQAQIAPHFLYNSFMFISNMLAVGEPGQARRFLHHLSKYYEYLTRNAENTIALKEEYVHCVNYMSIQGMRFDGLFDIQLELLPEEFWEILVPRLILQPLLENAIEHGMPPGEEGVAIRMAVELPVKEEYLCIRVENGGEITDSRIAGLEGLLSRTGSQTSGVSLYNINARLKLYYQDEACGLALCRSDLGGLCVRVTIRRRERKV